MADLSLTYTNLLSEAGYFLGYGTDTTAYTSEQTARADMAVQSGLRMFYYPPDVDGLNFTGWSFLNPTTTMTLTIGDYDYDLPTGFESFDGALTFPVGEGYGSIQLIDEPNLRQLRQFRSGTGTPQYAAIRAKTSDSTAVQEFEILFWPTPSEAKVLSYRYFMRPPKLSSSVLYPLGPPYHSETIRQAVLAAAELSENDEMGVHHEAFMERLRSSIRFDRRANTPEFFGRNTDESWLTSENQLYYE